MEVPDEVAPKLSVAISYLCLLDKETLSGPAVAQTVRSYQL